MSFIKDIEYENLSQDLKLSLSAFGVKIGERGYHQMAYGHGLKLIFWLKKTLEVVCKDQD